VADSVTQSVEIEAPVEAVRLPAAEVHYNRYSVLAARNLPRASYQWSPSSMITGVTSVANPSVRLTRPQEFLIEISFPSGCKTTDSLLVTIKDDELDVPNAFSPNGDGIHDTWVIPYLEVYPENVVEVYNRHGQLVYRAKGYPAPWNGTFKGSPLPVGTYYYIIDLKGGRKKMSGSITILR
ncbi:MAG TPA: gliding motility-associated C-terminal domain-containing protein, partial [Chitinophagaceae bacterium]